MQEGRRRSAFTLLEVLLVLVIIGLLAGLVAPRLFTIRDQANVDAAKGQINLFYNSCVLFKFKTGDYPKSLNELTDPSRLGEKVTEPLMDKIPLDPWGSPYVYEYQPGGKPLIYSLGPDKTPNTDDDVHATEEQEQR